ncbi:hypothetical protein [Acutalibacter intestini]|uniref:hypothetical protein n=1 Tax=Acutalibacter intestini TaxID=3093659 RepID=UPI002AC89B2F|nr:hypothetical protein [Acutalibacter sp. M00204]
MYQLSEICRVCFPKRDGIDVLNSQLALAMRKFFATGQKPVRVRENLTLNGYRGQVRGKLSRHSVYWSLKISGAQGNSVVLEEAFGQPSGWMLVTRDFTGVITGRSYFDQNHDWVKSEYYEPWDSTQAKVVFSPLRKDRQVLLRDWDPAKQAFRETRLALAPYQSGTAQQNVVDAQLGQPLLLLATVTGELCCCPGAQAQLREQATQDAAGEATILMPAWEVRDGALVDGEAEEPTTITFTSLEEYAKIEPGRRSAAPVSPAPPQPDLPSGEEFTPSADPNSLLEAPSGEEPMLSLETASALPETGDATADAASLMEADGSRKPGPSQQEHSATSTDLASSAAPDGSREPGPSQQEHSATSTDLASSAAPDGSREPGPSQQEHSATSTDLASSAAPDGSREPGPSQQENSATSTDLASSAAPDGSREPGPSQQEHSATSTDLAPSAAPDGSREPGPSQQEHSATSTDLASSAAPDDSREPGPSQQEHSTTSTDLASSAAPDGSRESGPSQQETPPLNRRGRTQQPNGYTSYEGDYVNGKRHGFGSYYYKDGNLCYAGFWKEDRRDGLGVSFRDSDHALHVANWKNGQPGGLVSLFDANGSLRFGGRIENGKKEGAGVVLDAQDGTVFVGQWKGGEPTGLGSAFDQEGRLLYYGQWKNGLRHGHGTEFDQNGAVVFDGQWREGAYYNGVLYQKLSQPDQE